jgi:hypothetical protein
MPCRSTRSRQPTTSSFARIVRSRRSSPEIADAVDARAATNEFPRDEAAVVAVFTPSPGDDHEDMHASAETTVVLADKAGIARAALALLVAETPGLELIAEVATV